MNKIGSKDETLYKPHKRHQYENTYEKCLSSLRGMTYLLNFAIYPSTWLCSNSFYFKAVFNSSFLSHLKEKMRPLMDPFFVRIFFLGVPFISSRA